MVTKPKPKKHKPGVTRRGLLTSVGAGVVSVATLRRATATQPVEDVAPDEMVKLTLRINGRTHRLLVEPRWSLLFVLRERLGLTGTKLGCDRGECGACTVLIDGRPRYACMTLALEAEGNEITTIEGLLRGEELGEMQKAFVEHDAFQCGYCTSGQIMAAEGLLRANSHPSREEVRLGMSGNLCRCGAYAHIVRAVEKTAELKGSRGAR